MKHLTVLSPEGVAELLEETNKPPRDTPERRNTFERARAMAPFVKKELQDRTGRWPSD